ALQARRPFGNTSLSCRRIEPTYHHRRHRNLRGVMTLRRRTFLGLATGAAALHAAPRMAAAGEETAAPLDPLVWPVGTKGPPQAGSFAGHADTVPDIVGRFGAPASLVIFTEGNHLMVLHGEDILGAFPAWAKSQPQYADLDLGNIILLTLPRPVVV